MNKIIVEVSIGELLDKISILEIKQGKIKHPEKLKFKHPENIAVLSAPCGNVIIELYPNLSKNSVERFKMLIKSGQYNNVSFHRVIKNVLVQAGDLKFGKKNNLNYSYIGTGKSGFGTIKSELSEDFEFKKGSVALFNASVEVLGTPPGIFATQ